MKKTLSILLLFLISTLVLNQTPKTCNHNEVMNRLFPNRLESKKSRVYATTINTKMTLNEENRLRAEGNPGNFKPIRIEYIYSCKKKRKK